MRGGVATGWDIWPCVESTWARLGRQSDPGWAREGRELTPFERFSEGDIEETS